MGNCPTKLRSAVRWNYPENVQKILDEAGDGAAQLINDDYSQDCILQSCSRNIGNIFYNAVSLNRLECIQIMINKGADIHTTGLYGETCVHCAARFNYTQSVKLLLESGCDLYATDDMGRYPIHSTGTSVYNTNNTIKYLLTEAGKKEDVNLKDFKKSTPLHEAARFGNMEAIRTFVEYGADPNAKTQEGNTPLHVAKRHVLIWDLLVELGADPTIANEHGHKPTKPD